MRSRTLKSSLFRVIRWRTAIFFPRRGEAAASKASLAAFSPRFKIGNGHAYFGAIIAAQCGGKLCAANGRSRRQSDGFGMVLQRLLAIQPGIDPSV